MKPKVIVLTGFGENCSSEASNAFELAGAESNIIHITDIISGKVSLQDYHILNWGGGFLDGDDLGSGKAGANRLKYARIATTGSTLMEEIMKFHRDGKLIGGQCNGFQVWVKAGLLPGIAGTVQEVTLAKNESGKFENRWVHLVANRKSPCIWTKGISKMYLPVRHGEGRLMVSEDDEGKRVLRDIKKNNLIALQYCDEAGRVSSKYPLNPNGSVESIAGMCDLSGRIFALMPHPEAYTHPYTHPFWTKINSQCSAKKLPAAGDGLAIFKNAVKYVKEELL
ncbi:MAG: phosphoribosylformylglycinamidine synthase subunit PurQ [Nanoarchaeota archaeon]|nr:MAG: phosphoribosylformylglycinamidine synthase subunit PurQ [Nanoarchaeota archaeon]